MVHTTLQMVPGIGHVVGVRVEGWSIPMQVKDVKSVWGKVRLLVEPVQGKGEAWIELTRLVKIEEGGKNGNLLRM